ncbi:MULTISPECIES: type II CRISPR RNA-guided endonuclease Cas9 [Coprobacillaceae]|uniref:type II CRISPR RNA-guided endonuclease Cas9 n=1 Tax=Coprobacillaceae TaxID=2810280 RepID=UPI000E4F79FE|nr:MULTISPECIES: type II CRISPR RNA-guided endonuclease Cas9 [Coprobacillaceae]RHM62104.1 type II CRISPR RNA-guided endonuclease Cas9 [Coprobacillus sp. AF33-1AC]RHS95981.1 type II CRISPR RNA-guided endonuclease Cas9 [Erysipelatoclostridium sp. AM42-17]
MGRLVLGLDIGITSVGYGVIDIDENTFVDYGVRLFKEGTASENEKRRASRSARRLKRRKVNRLEDMKKYLEKNNMYVASYYYLNPYKMRVKGLNEKLSLEELCCAIMHITKKRGTTLETLADETKDDEGTKAVLSSNSQLLKDGKFICEVQLERLNEQGHIRGTENNFKTEDYLHELDALLTKQKIDEKIKNDIVSIVARRRRYDQGPGSQISPTPYGSYRLVDNQLVHVNLIDVMRGKCSIFPDQLRAPKQAYTAELFNLLNDLNNLTINGEKISVEQKEQIIEHVNTKGNITVKQLLKLLDVKEIEVSGFRIDKNEKPILTEFKGFNKVLKIFKKYNQENKLDDKNIVDQIIDICTKAKGVEERYEQIKTLYPDFNQEVLVDLASMKGISGYHSLSLKAMKLLNKELLNTEMNQMQLLHQMDLFNKNRPSLKGKKNIEADDSAILSPVAKRAHRETFKVINDLRKKYGEFDSIVIETTRDKNTQEQKNRINENQRQFEKKNKEIDEIIKGAEIDPERVNNKTRNKIRLYLEQDCKTAYTQQAIDLHTLIFDDKAYEIDHIIPLSVSLDDSLSNKVLTSRLENQEKGNLTPIAAYLKNKFTDGNLTNYQTFVRNNKNMNRKKKMNLLFEEDITKYDVAKKFINRNLVDTSYACRTVMNTLQHYFKDNDIDTKVHTIKGQATNAFRKRINLPKEREQDYFHHAIDALIVASLKKMNLINSYLMTYDLKDLYDEKTGEVFNVLPDNQFLDPKYISFISNLKNIYYESNQYVLGLIDKDTMHYPLIKVSHKIDTKPNRQIADETIYSTRNVDSQEMLVERIKNIYDPKEKKAIELVNNIINDDTDKYIMKHKDSKTFDKIKVVVLDHFNTYKESNEYYGLDKKGKYVLKGENPLTLYEHDFGPITKYAKKNNGPAITSIKFYSEKLGNHLEITSNYRVHNKKVILKQISPYRTDFYLSPEGKYKFLTVRYKDVFYSKTKQKYIISRKWYDQEKQNKGIGDDWQFVCSMHRDELIGLVKKAGDKYVYDAAMQEGGKTQYHDGVHYEILKFTATNNDKKGMFEVKPICMMCNKRLMPSVGTFIKIQKFATDALGNMYEIKENILKLEFD